MGLFGSGWGGEGGKPRTGARRSINKKAGGPGTSIDQQEKGGQRRGWQGSHWSRPSGSEQRPEAKGRDVASSSPPLSRIASVSCWGGGGKGRGGGKGGCLPLVGPPREQQPRRDREETRCRPRTQPLPAPPPPPLSPPQVDGLPTKTGRRDARRGGGGGGRGGGGGVMGRHLVSWAASDSQALTDLWVSSPWSL